MYPALPVSNLMENNCSEFRFVEMVLQFIFLGPKSAVQTGLVSADVV